MGIAHALHQGEDDFAGLVGIGDGEDAFLDALAHDFVQQRRALFDYCLIHFLAHDGVFVGIPDPVQPDHVFLVGDAQAVERAKEALELLNGGQVWIVDDGQERFF